jgi:hypothetical protein
MYVIVCIVMAAFVLFSVARGQGKARTLVAVWAHADANTSVPRGEHSSCLRRSRPLELQNGSSLPSSSSRRFLMVVGATCLVVASKRSRQSNSVGWFQPSGAVGSEDCVVSQRFTGRPATEQKHPCTLKQDRVGCAADHIVIERTGVTHRLILFLR